MEIHEIETLIRFHKTGLEQYRKYYTLSVILLEESTIRALQELVNIKQVAFHQLKGD